jgi:hypothetical protein
MADYKLEAQASSGRVPSTDGLGAESRVCAIQVSLTSVMITAKIQKIVAKKFLLRRTSTK